MSTEPPLPPPAAATLSRISRTRCLVHTSLLVAALAGLGVLEGSSTSPDAVHPQQLPSSADQFVNEVLHHEVEAQLQDHALWTFLERKRVDGLWKLLHVYQTQEGPIDRLVEVNGQPLTPAQLEDEDQRIQRLISRPSQVQQRQKREHDDGVQAQNLLRMFPAAFRFQYDGKQGSLVRLRFTPNPQFQPTDHTAQVFHHMEGTMLLDLEQKRLAAINGTLTSEVKFFAGLLGHLDKGGTFAVTQQEVSPHLWEVTTMHVHMRGKALFFKTIDAQEDETYSDFRPVPSDTTLREAAELLKQSPIALPPTHPTTQAQGKD
jgi:hypothetical protein